MLSVSGAPTRLYTQKPHVLEILAGGVLVVAGRSPGCWRSGACVIELVSAARRVAAPAGPLALGLSRRSAGDPVPASVLPFLSFAPTYVLFLSDPWLSVCLCRPWRLPP